MYNYRMEIVLLIVIGLQFAYIIYKDVLAYKERESLQLKLMSRDVTEYKSVVEPESLESAEEEDDPYLPIEMVDFKKILEADE